MWISECVARCGRRRNGHCVVTGRSFSGHDLLWLAACLLAVAPLAFDGESCCALRSGIACISCWGSLGEQEIRNIMWISECVAQVRVAVAKLGWRRSL
jgi:hypothetical protein